MHIHEITAVAGRLGPKRKRIGRGIGSHGKTSGRGHKGESSRSGAKGYLLKEGGQMPMFRKFAKRGFSAGDYSAQKRIAIVNVGALSKLETGITVADVDVMISAGLIPRRSQLIRVLGGGDLSRTLTIEADYVSRSALQKIEAVGGKVLLR